MSTGLPTASPPRVPEPPPAVRRRPRAWIALAIAGLFAIAVSIAYALGTRSGGGPVETQAAPSVTSSPIDIASLDGVIVFGSTRNEEHLATCAPQSCNYDLYAINADGSGVRRLTDAAEPDYVGSPSPDGTKYVFVRPLRQGEQWLVMSVSLVDGREHVLLRSDRKLTEPHWSPDGNSIVFERYEPDGSAPLFLLDLRTDAITPLTGATVGGGSLDWAPDWSPDGSRIVFTRTGNDDPSVGRIAVVDVATGAVTYLTDQLTGPGGPTWSPDGGKIAYSASVDANREIFVMNADGSESVRLTESLGADETPSWSPDGSFIAFTSGRVGGYQIFVMRSDGSGVVGLTSGEGTNGGPHWSAGSLT